MTGSADDGGIVDSSTLMSDYEYYREERSLIYVAMTRAKKSVLLTGVSAHVG